jgi:hypothetical protein
MTLTVKDSAGTDVPLSTYTDGATEQNPRHSIITAEGAGATIGTTTDAAVITSANGSLSGKIRGLIALFLDAIGTAADAAVTTGVAGSISGKMRGLVGHVDAIDTQTGNISSSASLISNDVTNIRTTTGSTLDAAIVTNTTGSISGKLRGVVSLLVDIKAALVGSAFTIDNNFTRPGDTTAYAAGDALNNSTTVPAVLTLTSIASAAGSGGVIQEVILVDESNAGTIGSFYLWVTDTTFTPNNDNAAMALSTTILRTVVAVIPLTLNWAASTTGRVYSSGAVSIPFKTTGTANLFCTIQAGNAYTPANAGRFDLRVKGWQN